MGIFQTVWAVSVVLLIMPILVFSADESVDKLPIADVHVHYSHDSVELTPPARVIELMRGAGLKLALVSSSDDEGTQVLYDLAPDIIVPGLRPYRRRGEINSWFTDPDALAYVERLLATYRYASIGEFHLFGDSADLEIPRRIVQLADEHNLILHAHSDEDAVERLLAQNQNVKVIWAHSGFAGPEEIAAMLSKHDRLWADLAFRSDVGSGGSVSDRWRTLFETHPDRMMLGSDTYTPERMYYLPDHAEESRAWLSTLPEELAEKVAWKNGYDLIMPIWEANRDKSSVSQDVSGASEVDMSDACVKSEAAGGTVVNDSPTIVVKPNSDLEVSKSFSVTVSVCGDTLQDTQVLLDATMPAHGHGMNYKPEHTVLQQSESHISVNVEGLVLHMPGEWQWAVELEANGKRTSSEQKFTVR